MVFLSHVTAAQWFEFESCGLKRTGQLGNPGVDVERWRHNGMIDTGRAFQLHLDSWQNFGALLQVCVLQQCVDVYGVKEFPYTWLHWRKPTAHGNRHIETGVLIGNKCFLFLMIPTLILGTVRTASVLDLIPECDIQPHSERTSRAMVCGVIAPQGRSQLPRAVHQGEVPEL